MIWIEIFPQLTAEQLKYVYSLPMRNEFDSAVSCLMEGPTLEALQSLAGMQLVIPLSESPYIRVDAEADDEEVGAALAYYKHDQVNKAAYVRISMNCQPGIDTGEFADNFSLLSSLRLLCRNLCKYLMGQLTGFAPPLWQAICLLDCYPLLAQ